MQKCNLFKCANAQWRGADGMKLNAWAKMLGLAEKTPLDLHAPVTLWEPGWKASQS